jgi:hypothetical protein
MDIITLLIIIVFIMLVLGAYQVFGRYVMTYRLTDKGLRIMGIFGFFSIPYEEIVDVKIVSPKEVWKLAFSFNILRFGNRLWGTGVLIKKNSGLVRNLIISPNNSEEFTMEIRQRMNAR